MSSKTSSGSVFSDIKHAMYQLFHIGFMGIWLSTCAVAIDRQPWTTSRVKGSPEPPAPYVLERAYPHLKFNQPVELVALPGTNKMLLLEVGGKVFCFEDDKDCRQADLVCDLSECTPDVQRSFSICPHPDFANNQVVFACYAERPVAKPDGTKLSRFRLKLEPAPHIDLASEEVLLTWASGGHNGCSIRFDAHGLMYFSAGDGARPYPPDEYDVSQDLSDLRSTICRIDVDHSGDGRRYAIPADNPFLHVPGARPEIWAYGFRNPWRFCIDPETQYLLCGDVGWELWELLFHVEQGGNYGWSIYEGPQPIRADIQPGPTPIQKPIESYPHTEGLSITGGLVYRGPAIPELTGTYLYGDYVTGLLWGLRYDGQTVSQKRTLAETSIPIISFSENQQREPLVMSFTGEIYQLKRNQRTTPSEFPRKLSETGLFKSVSELEPSAGVYSYTLAAKAYEGDQVADFVVGLPGGSSVTTHRKRRNWKFPADTVFAKTISLLGEAKDPGSLRRVETQLVHYDGVTWQPYTYEWNEEQSDAILIGAEGKTSTINLKDGSRPRTWRYLARSECRACHTNQSGGAVGFTWENVRFSPSQEEARDMDASLNWLVNLNMLDRRPAAAWDEIEAMVDPYDASQPLERRARSYLHANCAHCHCRGGGGTVALDLIYPNTNEQINAIDFPATQGQFGLSRSHVVASGDPYSSVLYYRMATSGKGHMPKLWQRDNDTAGLVLIHDWISSLEPAEEGTGADANATQVALREFHSMLGQRETFNSDALKQLQVSANAVTLGLFERFLPAEERVQRLGNTINSEEILKLQGSARLGRKRFLTSPVQQCRTCHRLEGVGQMIGPDLDGIAGKRSRTELLQSIIEPSAKIEPQYATHTIVTVDGQVFSGLRMDQSDSNEPLNSGIAVVLRTADGQTHRFAEDEIEHQTRQSQSLMPAGLAAEMTAQELADLLAFLSELK